MSCRAAQARTGVAPAHAADETSAAPASARRIPRWAAAGKARARPRGEYRTPENTRHPRSGPTASLARHPLDEDDPGRSGRLSAFHGRQHRADLFRSP